MYWATGSFARLSCLTGRRKHETEASAFAVLESLYTRPFAPSKYHKGRAASWTCFALHSINYHEQIHLSPRIPWLDVFCIAPCFSDHPIIIIYPSAHLSSPIYRIPYIPNILVRHRELIQPDLSPVDLLRYCLGSRYYQHDQGSA
jgi:hypothetical protein